MSPRRLAATRRMQHRRKLERWWLRGFVGALRASPMEVGLVQGDTVTIDETGRVTIQAVRGSGATVFPVLRAAYFQHSAIPADWPDTVYVQGPPRRGAR